MPNARQEFRYRTVQTDAELAAYSRLVALAFGRTDDEAHAWTTKLIRPDLRILAHAAHNPSAPVSPVVISGIAADPNVVGGLLAIPMGQYFGGRSIPMVGVAGVAVAPESRGRGIATSIMKQFLNELAQNSVPLSGLFAATHRLYRSVGYEQAGHRFECRIPLARLAELMSRRPPLGARLLLRPIDPGDREAIYSAYATLATVSNGPLDRGAYIWGRIEQTGGKPTRGFVVIDPNGPEKSRIRGWVWFSQPEAPRSPTGPRLHEVTVHDIGALDASAAMKLWGFLSGFATTASELAFHCGPAHPMLMLLSEQIYSLNLREHWMIRITNIGAALRARSYPRGLSAKLHLDLQDDVIPENAGKLTLDIEGGEATVRKGGKGDFRTDIGTLAAIFTGYISPYQLSLIGKVEAPNASIETAAAIFAPAFGVPSLAEMY